MKKVLICVAHSDDETIGCGGTISYHKSKGHKVFCLSLTDGVGARGDKNNKAITSRKKSAIRVWNRAFGRALGCIESIDLSSRQKDNGRRGDEAPFFFLSNLRCARLAEDKYILLLPNDLKPLY